MHHLIVLLLSLTGIGVGTIVASTRFRRNGIVLPFNRVIIPSLRDGTCNLIPSLFVASIFLAGSLTMQLSGPLYLATTFLVTGICGFLNFNFFYPVMESRASPYDSQLLEKSEQHSTFDVFISYKAEDANLARDIANWLIASGGRPWFDEYVLVNGPHQRLSSQLWSGVRNSRHGLILSSEAYAKSKWTRIELRQLIKFKRNDNLTEIQLTPTAIDFPEPNRHLGNLLAQITDKLSFSGELETIQLRLREKVSLTEEGLVPFGWSNSTWTHNDLDWELELGPWTHVESLQPGARLLREIVVDEPVHYFELQPEEGKVGLSLIVGQAPATWRREVSQEIARHTQERFIDKREMQKTMLRFAKDWLINEQGSPDSVRGLHLLYLDAYPKVPQFGITYWNGQWLKRFSVVLDDENGQPIEFAFLASFSGDFRFCSRFSSLCEYVVRSLRWKAGSLVSIEPK